MNTAEGLGGPPCMLAVRNTQWRIPATIPLSPIAVTWRRHASQNTDRHLIHGPTHMCLKSKGWQWTIQGPEPSVHPVSNYQNAINRWGRIFSNQQHSGSRILCDHSTETPQQLVKGTCPSGCPSGTPLHRRLGQLIGCLPSTVLGQLVELMHWCIVRERKPGTGKQFSEDPGPGSRYDCQVSLPVLGPKSWKWVLEGLLCQGPRMILLFSIILAIALSSRYNSWFKIPYYLHMLKANIMSFLQRQEQKPGSPSQYLSSSFVEPSLRL